MKITEKGERKGRNTRTALEEDRIEVNRYKPRLPSRITTPVLRTSDLLAWMPSISARASQGRAFRQPERNYRKHQNESLRRS
ncbi:hypothetical protein F9L69_08830 [Brucella melitensis]|uniref:Uncharacterized protein n=1 Tax=Brucella melitensis biotype 1 (strain ATCC 23456 / CCUG 17765 / NCTC 10094 / 16M) TaxID=224914 RepID=Q8XF28_BRUME|nr:hypothetical protein BMEI0904 [Brucella melitensis bv. 1 str. 16M]ATV12602.1 hypothetical protein CT124_01510 [Brucella melitensis]RTQ38312.1 hypothetical protein EJW28_16560 [Brucella abortus]AAL52840.1 hypothetical protein BMEI1659 [Brucella melitensis bv. 1 str. 16M]ATV13289.1 hypothetical protein CT124_05585 [Brucella melitensis]